MDLYGDTFPRRLLRAVRRAFYAAAAAWLWFWLSPADGGAHHWAAAIAGPVVLFVVYRLLARLARSANDEFDSLA